MNGAYILEPFEGKWLQHSLPPPQKKVTLEPPQLYLGSCRGHWVWVNTNYSPAKACLWTRKS